MFKKIAVVLIASLAMTSYAFAATSETPTVEPSEQSLAEAPEKHKMTAEEFLASLNMQSGTIELPNKIATLKLTEKFRYISPDSAERLLVDAWGNPPGSKTLGMILSADTSPLSAEGWGVIITYSEDGFVKDDDADKINYEELLADMKEQAKAASDERVKEGYGPMLLVGWAEKPSYDKQARKLYWAKQYSTERAGEDSLNYNIRVLGRKGVLVLNAIAGMNQLAQIKSEMPAVLAMTEFTAGNRYEDFDSKTDHVAEYGLAALVAGGVTAKLGLFAKLFALLIAFKKFVLLGVVAIGAAVKSFFGRKK